MSYPPLPLGLGVKGTTWVPHPLVPLHLGRRVNLISEDFHTPPTGF